MYCITQFNLALQFITHANLDRNATKPNQLLSSSSHRKSMAVALKVLVLLGY